MSSKKLDRSRAFGEVWGGMMNARFMQDGVYFDHEERPLAQLVDRSEGDGAGPAPMLAPDNVTTAPAGMAADVTIDAETIINARRGHLMPKAIVLLEGKADDIVVELADHDEEMLAVMLEVEGLVKKRVSVTAALTAALQAKMAETERNTQAQTQAPQPVSAQGEQKVNAPSATFGSMAQESQLSTQLSG